MLSRGDVLVSLSSFSSDGEGRESSFVIRQGDLVVVVDIIHKDIYLLHALGPIRWGSHWQDINVYFARQNVAIETGGS